MSSADLFEDGYPHGTVEGYQGGCRGGSCPAGVEHGLSCKRANQLNAGDYRYQRLVREGLTPAAIADALDGKTPTSPAPAAVERTTPEETPDMPTPADVAKTSKPLTVAPVPEISADVDEQPTPDLFAPLTTEKWTAGMNAREKTAKLGEIRDWLRRHGFPGLPAKGKIPQDALAAYDKAHSNQVVVGRLESRPVEGGIIPAILRREAEASVALDTGDHDGQTFTVDARPDEAPAIIPEEVAERVEAFIDEELAALNAEADGEPDFDPDEIGAPTNVTPMILRGAQRRDADVVPLEVDTTGFEELLEQARERAEAPRPERPEWAEVAISVDVERARDLACRLEQELAHTTEQLAIAHAAVETVLQKWAADKAELQATITELTITAGIATGAANIWADLYQAANDQVARLRVQRETAFASELERFLSPPEAPKKPKRRIRWRNGS